MADVKISALPASTTPLAGTEVLPIVQGTTTKQVSVANLTAGRAVSAASLSTTGDITSSGYLRFNTYGSNVNDFALYITAAGGTTMASQSAITLRTADVTRLSIGATGGVSIGNTTDPGATNLSVTGSVTTSGGYKVPYTLIETGIPFVLTSGSMGNNGALTLTTAVATAYPSAYVYMPAGAIEVGSAAGWYYAVFSTTGAATIYNNVYSSGQPTIPASPTAFSTTGPGAFTFSTASSYSGVSVTLAANAMGINGSVEFIWTATANNSANSKFARALFGGQTPAGATAFTSQTNGRFNATVQNRGVANAQTTNGASFANGNVSAANSTTAINTASNVTINSNLFLNASTSDVLVMESFKVIVYPS
jgi:hypothetical protein